MVGARSVFDALAASGASRCLALIDPPSGLRAFLVLDDLRLGPAAGGVRTRRYADEASALADAAALARAMTLKCALAGLPAGGGKVVVLEREGMDRRAAFAALGAHVEILGGLFRTAGDAGTTAEDLAAMATRTRYVHPDGPELGEAAGRGLVRAIEAAVDRRTGSRALAGVSVCVMGLGSVGAAAARALAAAGARLLLADVDARKARLLADELGAGITDPAIALRANVDILAPCALGGVVTEEVAERVRAYAVVGAANNLLASAAAGLRLFECGVLHVPDVIASAGAVIAGLGRTLLGLEDPGPRVDAIYDTALAVLDESAATGTPPEVVAEARARRIIAAHG